MQVRRFTMALFIRAPTGSNQLSHQGDAGWMNYETDNNKN